MTQRTLIIIKPDAVQRHLIGEIISRFEKKGLKIVAAKFIKIPEQLARKHYGVHQGKPFFEPVVKYISSSPVLVMVWQANGVIDMARKLMGSTFGCDAQPGTIRGDFGGSKGFNLIHGSDAPETAEFEIGLYFKPEEIVDYDFADNHWIKGND